MDFGLYWQVILKINCLQIIDWELSEKIIFFILGDPKNFFDLKKLYFALVTHNFRGIIFLLFKKVLEVGHPHPTPKVGVSNAK